MKAQLLVALLTGAIGGALLTNLTSLLTGWQTRRHERRRWLNDKRLEIYSAFNAAVNEWGNATAGDQPPERIARRMKALSELTDRVQAVRLVAPKKTGDLAMEVVRLILTADHDRDAAEKVRVLTVDERMELHADWAAKYQELFVAQLVDLQGNGRKAG